MKQKNTDDSVYFKELLHHDQNNGLNANMYPYQISIYFFAIESQTHEKKCNKLWVRQPASENFL